MLFLKEAIPEGFSSTSYIKHLTVSELSSISVCIKSSCNLTGKCFELPNVSYTQPLWAIPPIPETLIT